jgi:hypothetical protein
MMYFCSQTFRRALVLKNPTLNGIDFLEVGGPIGAGKQLLLTMLHDARTLSLSLSQIVITGGAADAQVNPVSVSPGTNDSPFVVTIELNQSGDFSPYTLRLIAQPGTDDPPDGIDPALSQVTFSFKAGCPTIGDCVSDGCCPPDLPPEPDINYLAKDYLGFRQVMLDRMAVLTSTWTETHEADIGVMLVELLAYVADHLSYQQDAVGTEAYIGTARSRISLRRHARLVDYRPSEGCNARAWIYMHLDPAATDGPVIPPLTQIYPRVPGLPPTLDPSNPRDIPLIPQLLQSAPAFSTMSQATLYHEQNEIQFYTWSDTNCCLGPGSTQATLIGTLSTLKVGTVLIFEEVIGPETGDPDDANPANRWAVMLTEVRTTDYKGGTLVDPLNGTFITKICWASADALPFPLCISSTTDAEHGQKAVPNVSVARGNMVPADQGLWIPAPENLGEVPTAVIPLAVEDTCACGSTSPVDSPRPYYYPQLANSPLTFALPFDNSSASVFLNPPSFGLASPTPEISVTDDLSNPWPVLDDLLSLDENQKGCVVEIEYNGTVFLRFGDGQYGTAPPAGAIFQAYYRVGNGSIGNVGHDTLAHALTSVPGITLIRNPLAAAGGVDPETMQHIQQTAPFAFLTQLRAVTEDDYGTMAEQDPAIRAARGTLRWTGSWYTAFVSIESVAENLTPSLVKSTEKRLNLLRMMGTDLDAEAAWIVGLRIEMEVCVDSDHFQGDVEAAIEKLLITGNQCNGQPGMLNADNFTFGQTIYASPLVAAVQGVEGVSSVTLTVLQRMDDPSIDGAAQGWLTMGRLEIARCDNDPNRLDHGILTLHMDGGK